MSVAEPPRSGPPSASHGRNLRRLAGRVRWSLVNDRFDVYVRPVEAAHARFDAPQGYRFAFGGPAELERCTSHHTDLHALDHEHGRLRLESGHRLVLGYAGVEPVFTMWVNPRNLNVPEQLKRRLTDHQEFIYKAFTSPDHRGKRLYQAGMAFVLADMARRGLRELVGYAHTAKRASRGGLDRLGFSSVGHYRVFGLRGSPRVRVSPRLARRFPQVVPRSDVGWLGTRPD